MIEEMTSLSMVVRKDVFGTMWPMTKSSVSDARYMPRAVEMRVDISEISKARALKPKHVVMKSGQTTYHGAWG